MMKSLWSSNTRMQFWLCRPDVPVDVWQAAIQKAVPSLGLCAQPDGVDELLSLVLGEAQFGPSHWHLSPAKRLYYALKPLLPHAATRLARQFYSLFVRANFRLGWPIEDRYARFQWEVMRELLITTGKSALSFRYFWPEGHRFAFVLTHDVETAKGQAYVRTVADLDESLGFRSSFNFVPERYSLDYELIEELRGRGFEIGVHGLNHDGKLFNSQTVFMQRTKRINHHLKALGAVGFRSPYVLRHPEWMQALEIEHDLSFFDTDPFEPMPGGVMSIWPFIIGRFVELPYTLVQDSTLTGVLREKTAQIWLAKVDFVATYYGMALLAAHPDYLADEVARKVYAEFLQAMRMRGGYWHALPRDVARWWRARSDVATDASLPGAVQGKAKLDSAGIAIEL